MPGSRRLVGQRTPAGLRRSLRRTLRPAGLAAAGVVVALAVALANSSGKVEAQPAPLVVPVALEEWAVRVGAPSVPAGVPVRLVATNNGGITHALSVTGLNVQTPLLAPGESASLDVVFATSDSVTLFCPVGGGSHRQRGMEAPLDVEPLAVGQLVQPTPAPGATATPVTLTAPGANVDRVGLPANYRTGFLPFYVFDRADNRQVRAVFVNPAGAQVREGQPYPYGTILVMETYRAQLTADGQIALDPSGRFIRDELTGIFVMRKERGFGEKYGIDRTGEWEYVSYRPDGSGLATPPERSQACAQCHLAVSDAQRDWVVRANLFFQSRPSLPAALAGLPRTGAHAIATGTVPAGLLPFALAAGAPLLVLAGLALRSLSRRR